MHMLASYYNMSTFHYKTLRLPEGRDYLLEVNPNYVNREQNDKLNVIDARWIDTESGLFIDITTVRYNLTHPAGEGILSCKDGHEFRVRRRLSGAVSHKLFELANMRRRTRICTLSSPQRSRGRRSRYPTSSRTCSRPSMDPTH